MGHDVAHGKVIASNGHEQVRAYCATCGQRSRISVKHSAFTATALAAMPLLKVNACSTCGGPGCAICVAQPCSRRGCGSYEHVHDHHVAHRSIFGEAIADEFGTVPLCQKCHSELHAAFDRRVVAA